MSKKYKILMIYNYKKIIKNIIFFYIIISFCLLLPHSSIIAKERLRLATTTSIENSGLLNLLVSSFKKKLNIQIDILPVGTAKAIILAKNCDVDLIIVHNIKSEKKTILKGFGINRQKFINNYFIIIGPASDPAQINKAKNIVEAFKLISQNKSLFISRGDLSGTHIKENEIWETAKIYPNWKEYKEVGQGMGRTLTITNQLQAYTLTDISTYYRYTYNKGLDLQILLKDNKDPILKNTYSIILINPNKCKKTNIKLAKIFINYLLSSEAEKIIKNYKLKNQRLFWIKS